MRGPGSTPSRRLTEGKVLEGYWFNRQQEYAARRRREDFRRLEYATRETLALDPLPCWRHLPEEQRRRLVSALVEEVEVAAAAHRERTGIKASGSGCHPDPEPPSTALEVQESPALAFHAASQAVRRELRDLYHEFVAAYREAAKKLRAGDRRVAFPVGSFPPALPFVGG